MSNVTFVTAFLDISQGMYTEKDVAWRFEKFHRIAETGIQLCVYVDESGIALLRGCMDTYSNIKFMKVVSLDDLWINTCIKEHGKVLTFPYYRSEDKDTLQYMILINSKIEFLKDTIKHNPWNSSHFAWVDFSISYIFDESSYATDKLIDLSTTYPVNNEDKFLAIPGCWRPDTIHIEQILIAPHWRYCGGFLLGDAESIMELATLYEKHFLEFLVEYNTMVWEVNFWTWLEGFRGWKPNWYSADHNNTIFDIPQMT